MKGRGREGEGREREGREGAHHSAWRKKQRDPERMSCGLQSAQIFSFSLFLSPAVYVGRQEWRQEAATPPFLPSLPSSLLPPFILSYPPSALHSLSHSLAHPPSPPPLFSSSPPSIPPLMLLLLLLYFYLLHFSLFLTHFFTPPVCPSPQPTHRRARAS